MNREVLDKAIMKAIANGWKGVIEALEWHNKVFYYPNGEELLTWNWDDNKQVFHDGEFDDYEEVRIEAILYDHDFAKALWGSGKTVYRAEVFESPIEGEAGYDEYCEAWEYHLREMVISEDPIEYLAKTLEL